MATPLNLEPQLVSSRMDGVEAHVAHLRHLSRAGALASLLEQRHGFPKEKARERAEMASPFIRQGLQFRAASQSCPLEARWVMQYYAYLNLAVAVVHVHEPLNWQRFQTHGAKDMTHKVTCVELATELMKVRPGAISLFHAVISAAELPPSLTLQDLLVAIPMVDEELRHVSNERPATLHVLPHLETGNENRIRVEVDVAITPVEGNQKAGVRKFPLELAYRAMPRLQEKFTCERQTSQGAKFVTKWNWTDTTRSDAERYLREEAMSLINFGGHTVIEPGDPKRRIDWAWQVTESTQPLPTLTACLLLAFSMASLSRYRANLLDRIAASELGMVFEVFSAESDGIVVPAMRNLLFGEVLCIGPMRCG